METYVGQGFEIAVPKFWERLVNLNSTVAFVAREPDNGGVFRANIVVTVEDIDDQERWQRVAMRALAEHLQDYLLLDERSEGGGVQRLFHHLVPDSGAITAEQWAWPAGHLGFTLTASAATFDYDDQAELFTSIASRFRLQRFQQ